MKILHIIPSLNKGGAERLVINICQSLRKIADVEVALVTFSADNAYSELTDGLNWIVIPSSFTPSITKKSINNTSELSNFCSSYKPDIIHTHLFEAEMVSRHAIYSNAIYFTHCHDNMQPYLKFNLKHLFNKRKLALYFERNLILKQYAKTERNYFIAISNDNASYFKKNLPAYLQKNISVLLNAVDTSCFKRKDHSKEQFPLAIDIVNSGSFIPRKNQQFLIEIGQYLKEHGIPFSITLLGDGNLREKLEMVVNQKGLSDSVRFIGNTNQVSEYLNEATIYVHCAKEEAFGLAILEAMAVGIPVVTLNGGGNSDLIINGETGIMLDEETVIAFVDAIRQVVSDKTYYTKLVENGYELASNLDITNYTKKLIELYQLALSEKN